MKLPAPSADTNAYEQTLQNGLLKYPERKENYERFKAASKKPTVEYLPLRMDYEVTSRCNFRCVMCMVSERKQGGDMAFESFRRSIDELYGLVEVKLQGLGEPLLNKDIYRMISYAAERFIWSRLTVNGSLLHINDNYKRLIDSNPGEVQLSIDGATKDVYEKIRRGADFDTVVKNAAMLNQYAESLGLQKTRCWTVVQKYNEHQLFEIIELADKMAFRRITFSITLSNFGSDYWEEKNKALSPSATSAALYETGLRLIEHGRGYGIEVTFWDGSNKYSLNGGDDLLCAWLFERAFISSDMKVVPCCVISSPEVCTCGSASDFRGVWNNDIYVNLRQSHLNRTPPSFCRQCYE
ncbi:MAG: radical SAM protein [Candidatus Magnetominusculus sp. LBB02]|nr:radical SAM protein [Candidatus Magnetominusculus sp. LBB02]